MADPPTTKQPVKLVATNLPVSRIRRDPAPAAKKTVHSDPADDIFTAAIGITGFTLAIIIVIFGFGIYVW